MSSSGLGVTAATADAVAAALSAPGSPGRAVLNTAYASVDMGISVLAAGVTGDGVTDDTAAIQAVLNSATRVHFPAPAVAYRITGRLIPKPGQVITGNGWRSVIRQDTWGEPVFDAIDIPDLTIQNLRCTSAQPRTWGTAGARGDSAQLIGSAVWSNGDRLTLRLLWVDGLYAAVTLSSWNGVDLTSRQQTGVTIDGLNINNVDFGILAKGQKTCRISNVTGSYTYATPLTGTLPPPPHAVYFSSIGYPSRDVVITNCSAENGSTDPNAYAFQLKGVYGGAVSSLTATTCRGVLSLFTCEDLNISDVVSIDDQSQGQGSIYFGDSTINRCTIDRSVIRMSVEQRAIRLDGTDNKIRNLDLYVSHAANLTSTDVQVYGTRNTLTNTRIINSGAGSWYGIILESGDGHRVTNPTGLKVFSGVLVSNATNCVIDYDPANFASGDTTGSAFRCVRANATLMLTRAPRVTRTTANGGTIQPEASSQAMLEFTTTGTANMTVANPRTESRAIGMTLAVTIANSTAGAAGTLAWGTDYAFRTAAPVSPAAGARLTVSFIWDGTLWQETGRV